MQVILLIIQLLIMKFKKFTGVFALLIAACLAFAFKPMENKIFACVWFDYNGPQPATLADARNPANYTYRSTTPTCPGAGKLCAICVPASEIYNQGTPTDPTDDTPKVDISTTDAYLAIDDAETSGTYTDATHGAANVLDKS